MFSNVNTIKIILHLLILFSALPGIVHGQSDESIKSSNKPKTASINLPSFSIFPTALDKRINQNELEEFLSEIQKPEIQNDDSKERLYYWIIPQIFFTSRKLFAKQSWTPEEIKQGQQIGDFFARLVNKPDLKIKGSDRESFRQGLIKLRDWFASLCQDNKTLAAMIFTMDDGPFIGGEIDLNQFPKMKLIESTSIPGQRDRFVLMTDGSHLNPMIIGVQNADGSARWLRRYSSTKYGTITNAWLQKRAVYELQEHGYAIALMTEGSAGVERSHVYLDDRLNLRFYFVSW